MKLNILLSLSLLSLAAFISSLSAAEEESTVTQKKVVVALKTDDVELHKVDISHLQPGEAETIFTEDGKTIDLLRTEDEVEIYVDGELLDPGSAGSDHHKVMHVRHKEINTECADGADCEEMLWFGEDEIDGQVEQHDAKKVYIIHKEVKTS